MSLRYFTQATKSLNIVLLIALTMSILMGVLIFFIVQSRNTTQSLIDVMEDNHTVTRKMELYGQLMEYARSRTRLSTDIILAEDPFVQDEINLKLEIFANQYARVRLELLELPLSEEEKKILESQSPIVGQILPAQREAVTLAMQGDDYSRQQARQLMESTVYPGQTRLIDSFLKLMDAQTRHQREKMEKGRFEQKAIAREMEWITNLFLFPGLIVTFFVIYRVYQNQHEVNDTREHLEQIVKEKTSNLRHSEERLNHSQHIAHIGTWDWDIKEGILYWSDETFRIFGFMPQQFLPSYDKFTKYIHKADVENVNTELQRALSDPDYEYHVYHRITRTNGEERAVEEIGEVVRDDKGVPIRMIGVVHDITDRMQAEKMKNEFVSIISHELRTPLTAIQGSIKLLLGNALGEIQVGARNILELANNNCDRLLHLVNDILDIQKMESGKMDFHFEDISVSAFMHEVVNAGMSYAMAHNVKLIKQQVDDATIHADRMRLMQVMNNLISNAVKFSEAGAKVEVSAIRNEEDKILFAVKDHGRGIPDDYHDRLFKRFIQVDSSDKREKLGTGLGLAISKNIVEEHRGHIWYDSEVGVGTTFYFDIAVATG